MISLVSSLVSTPLWQLALAVLMTVAGSSAISALIKSLFDARASRLLFKRQSRATALSAIGNAYATYLKFAGEEAASFDTGKRDELVTEVSAAMYIATASIGEKKLLDKALALSSHGELYAVHDEEISAGTVSDKFQSLVEGISRGIPS